MPASLEQWQEVAKKHGLRNEEIKRMAPSFSQVEQWANALTDTKKSTLKR